MAVNLKQMLRDKAPIKVCSFILGYALYFILSQNQPTTKWFNVPICFYGKSKAQIAAPEFVTVALRAKKIDLQNLNSHTLAAHINSAQLKDGPNAIDLTAADLFLPEFIKLVHYKPSNLTITVTKQSNTAA